MSKSIKTAPEVATLKSLATRKLTNLHGFVYRKHLTGWVDRNAQWQFRMAFAAVLAYEEATDPETAGKMSDRLHELRIEAMDRGLLTAADVLRIEHEEVDKA